MHTPLTAEDLEQHVTEFELAGMPGTPASSDATSAIYENCIHRLRRVHLGAKSKYATRTFNTTVDHRRRYLDLQEIILDLGMTRPLFSLALLSKTSSVEIFYKIILLSY